MIRLIHCVTRRTDVSVDEFRHFWNSSEFHELSSRLTDLASPIEVRKNLTLDIPLTDFVNMTTRGHVAQLIISGDPNTVYVDNILFHK